MSDVEIRKNLKKKLREQSPDALLIDELGILQGQSRVDIAVIDTEISSYEIKSDRDSLSRLQLQIEAYNKVLDKAVLVTTSIHLERAICLLPSWWGVLEVSKRDGQISFQKIRQAEKNPDVDPYALVQLLWRGEALNLLTQLKLDKGLRAKPRKVIWSALASAIPTDALRLYVALTLAQRQNWR